MSIKRKALSVLSKLELLEIGHEHGLDVKQSMRVDELIDVIAGSKRARIEKVLPLFSRDRLKEVCELLGLPVTASNKGEYIDRILGRDDAPEGDDQLSLLAAPKPAPPEPPKHAPPPPVHVAPPTHVAAPAVVAATPPARPEPPPQPVPAAEMEAPEPNVLSRAVPPRQPRLLWHGWDRQELTSPVPTQVVEIVRPMRVQERAGELAGLDARVRRPSAAPDAMPPNRLIWTNDNLVALKTLLDEKDPAGGYRYRGKVDLVYIDPPFMVQSDFLAQNAIDIDLDDDVHVKKEPSLVEILAYKDTWRQGLDSFLSMLRARLELLKELLAPTGSIYVHLDWHAVHYVKVLMDEVFGYESFRNEVIWKRRTGYMGTYNRLGSVTDTLLLYASSASSWFQEVTGPHDPDYIARFKYRDERGRLYRLDNLTSPNPRPNLRYVYKGFEPPPNGWAVSLETMEQMDREGRIDFPRDRTQRLQRRSFLEEKEGMPVQNLWDDVSPVNPMALEGLGYPTQKPLSLLERAIAIACPPHGIVLDCFAGSGTTMEAAERLGRHWIGIDNGKYAIHLARKRLIQLHGQKRPAEKPQYDYVECEHCKNIERKERAQRSPGTFDVRPFTVENMGVYQRAETWQSFQTEKNVYRDEMIKVFGGAPVEGFRLLHGKKGDGWIHVGPLDGPVSRNQIWEIAREARRTELRHVTVLSADFDTIESGDHEELAKKLDGMRATIRVIPAAALDEIRRRIEHQRTNPDAVYSSTTIPAFYAPLAIVLRPETDGNLVRLHLDRCEVDVESFIESQRPALAPITEGMPEAKRKKAESEQKRWSERRRELEAWLRKTTSWRSFVDFWAVDWQYGEKKGPDGKPVFETDWQSFRQKKSKTGKDELAFTAERVYDEPGNHRIAARVTDVFGNDGIATVEVDVG
ncbi:MAG: site-specific DNA-methyltransferase [Sandaracinus sp.]